MALVTILGKKLLWSLQLLPLRKHWVGSSDSRAFQKPLNDKNRERTGEERVD